jgi:hypothetical protein
MITSPAYGFMTAKEEAEEEEDNKMKFSREDMLAFIEKPAYK